MVLEKWGKERLLALEESLNANEEGWGVSPDSPEIGSTSRAPWVTLPAVMEGRIGVAHLTPTERRRLKSFATHEVAVERLCQRYGLEKTAKYDKDGDFYGKTGEKWDLKVCFVPFVDPEKQSLLDEKRFDELARRLYDDQSTGVRKSIQNRCFLLMDECRFLSRLVDSVDFRIVAQGEYGGKKWCFSIVCAA